eukprot:COSAG06_NODE_67928_length_247_cov_58.094595_1_plen_59_part_01
MCVLHCPLRACCCVPAAAAAALLVVSGGAACLVRGCVCVFVCVCLTACDGVGCRVALGV